jgi:hypothetical protein
MAEQRRTMRARRGRAEVELFGRQFTCAFGDWWAHLRVPGASREADHVGRRPNVNGRGRHDDRTIVPSDRPPSRNVTSVKKFLVHFGVSLLSRMRQQRSLNYSQESTVASHRSNACPAFIRQRPPPRSVRTLRDGQRAAITFTTATLRTATLRELHQQ